MSEGTAMTRAGTMNVRSYSDLGVKVPMMTAAPHRPTGVKMATNIEQNITVTQLIGGRAPSRLPQSEQTDSFAVSEPQLEHFI